MRYYEIIRLSNQDTDPAAFNYVRNLVRRGWLSKAMTYLQEYDYGGENVDTARVYGRIWDSPTDPAERGDTVIRYDDIKGREETSRQYLVESSSADGLYLAYYLTGELPDEELF